MASPVAVATGDVAGDLPPIDLPSLGDRRRPSIVVRPSRTQPAPRDEWDAVGFKDAPPGSPPSAAAPQSDNWEAAGFGDAPPEAKPPAHEVGTGEAVGAGVKNALTFGAAPAISGLSEASGKAGDDAVQSEADAVMANPMAAEAAGGATIAKPIMGALKLLHEHFSDHPDKTVQDAYERGRKAALEDQKLAQEQHPYAYMGGQLAGSLMTPMPGLGPATTAVRIGKGMAAGAIGGGAYGAGNALSEGKDAGEIGHDVMTGAAIGAPLGGVVSGAIGPRLKVPGAPGQRAAETADQLLGAPLPKGLASDTPWVQDLTQKVAQFPLIGSKISKRAGKTIEAAGNKIEEISSSLAPTTDRAAADATVRSGLQTVIDNNKSAVDAAYGGVRSAIDQDAQFTMPSTQAALNAVKRARAAAGHANPSAGLEQFENVSRAATFNGAHRARVDAREAGNPLVPHPGYNAADYNRLTGAMTADLRGIVQAAAKGSPGRALKAFEDAEKQFGVLSDQNKLLHRLVNAKGEAAIATLLGAGKEKGGNLALLQQLRTSMPTKDFEQITATLLDELGHGRAGDFSLRQFVSGWNNLSDGAKAVLFTPSHRKMLEDIVHLGEHLKDADKYRNTSNSGGVIVMFEVLQGMIETALAVASGLVKPVTAVKGAATGAAGMLLAGYLASPAKTAAINSWVKAYRGATRGAATSAQKAVFVVATRNLANNLGIPANDLIHVIQSRLPLAADTEDNKTDH